jgi:hypothetical protein
MSRLLDFAGFNVRDRRGTYFELPIVHWIVRSLLFNMSNWLLARSVVHSAVKQPEGG